MTKTGQPQGAIVVSNDTPNRTTRLSLVLRGLKPSLAYSTRFGPCVSNNAGGAVVTRFRSTARGTARVRRVLPGAVLNSSASPICKAGLRWQGLPGEDSSYVLRDVLISSYSVLSPTEPLGPWGLTVVTGNRRGEPKGVLIALLLPFKAGTGEPVNAGPYSLTVPLGQGDDQLASVAVSPDGSAFINTTLDDQSVLALATREGTSVAVGDVNNDIVARGPLSYGSFGELPRAKAGYPSAPGG
jgi:hypothetical protein